MMRTVKKILKTYTIGEVSRITQIHPSTIRLYEKIKYIPQIKRLANNYRVFTDINIIQLEIAWLALRFTWLSGSVRKKALEVISCSVNNNFYAAYSACIELNQLLKNEKKEAVCSVRIVEQWLAGEKSVFTEPCTMSIKEAAVFTGTSPDMLRSWEKNGLLKPKRNMANKYRVYGEYDIERIMILYTLRKARYSTMAILRMFLKIDRGTKKNLVTIIDTPRPDEDVMYATDKWITTLSNLAKNR